MGKISKDKRDIFYRLAKQNNFRSRSAYKLLQIDSHFNIFENVNTIVDLCAAPGGWSQVCATKSRASKIVSVDLQKFSLDFNNVSVIIGDITSHDTLKKISDEVNSQIDLVICDGAPDVTGLNEFDVYVQSRLILNALNISVRLLKIGGNFVTKIFKGKYTEKIVKIFLTCFERVFITKPKACRNASFESFVVCKGFKIDDEIVKMMRNKELNCEDIIYLNKLSLNFDKKNKDDEFDYDKFNVECFQVGDDLYDSDKTYDLACTNYAKILDPVANPINPPYKFYIENLKGKSNKK
jgi:tRNA (cytidine32/guanosine34-2'-O)-methyltransferase